LLVVLCGVVLPGVVAPEAFADGAPTGSDLQVAQTLGDRELTVVIRRVEPVPGPLRVDLVTHAGSPPGTLKLRVTAPDAATSEGSVTLPERPGMTGATLRVDRSGPWQLALDDGQRVATIPFVVPARITTAWEKAAYGGFVGAGVFLVAALVVAVRWSARVALLPAGGVLVALAVAVTAAVLSSTIPPPVPPGSQLDPTFDQAAAPPPMSTTDYSRPAVNLVADRVGGELRLRLSDGSTGRPVDDLLVHDDAFVHLAVVSPGGRLWHLHPVRIAAGDYRVPLAAPETGRYAVSAELERRGGGVQVLRTALDLTAQAAGQTGSGAQTTAQNSAQNSAGGQATGAPTNSPAPASPAQLVTTVGAAGTPSTITARFGSADLQPWLGMLGHLLVTGPIAADADASRAPVWAHVHAMLPPQPGVPDRPDETVAGYGPDVAFTYTFPLPGRYLVWAQAERGYQVLTAPAVVDVPGGAG
jgi:hypothetical protein